jgi:hypothetical protein
MTWKTISRNQIIHGHSLIVKYATIDGLLYIEYTKFIKEPEWYKINKQYNTIIKYTTISFRIQYHICV